MACVDLVGIPNERCFLTPYDCINFKFLGGGALVSPATFASFDIDILAGEINGTFTFLGVVFTITTPATNTAQDNAAAIVQIITSHYSFVNSFTITYILNTPTQVVLNFTSITPGALSSFVLDFSGLLPVNVITFTGGTNGTEADLREGFEICYQLWDAGTDTPLTPLNSTKIPINIDGTILPITINFARILAQSVYTTYPELNSVVLLDETIKRRFYVTYFCKYKASAAACDYYFSEVQRSSTWLVLNTIFDSDDPTGYNNNTDICYRPRPFIGCHYGVKRICNDSYAWLWFCADLNTAEDIEPPVAYDVEYTFYKDGTQIGTSTTPLGFDSVYIIPTGTLQSPVNGFPNADCYTVQIFTYLPAKTAVSVAQKYIIANCCDGVELYYLSCGNYETIRLQAISNIDIDSSYIMVCGGNQCGATYPTNLRDGGVEQILTLGLQKLTLTSKCNAMQRVDEFRRMMTRFLLSPVKFIRHKDKAGNYVMRRFLVEGGTTGLYQKGDVLEIKVTGFFGDGINAIQYR